MDTLTRRGYTRGGWAGHVWRRDLGTPIPDVPLAAGYIVRSLGGMDELPVRSWASWRELGKAVITKGLRHLQWMGATRATANVYDAQANALYRSALGPVCDLAWLWPLWGEPSEYAPYCAHVTRLIRQYARREVRSLLNLGCGGGKNIFNLRQDFAVTGLDISPAMLDLARRLNPECRFVQADMRTFSLPERFDAILIDDAISYMTTEADLRAVFE